MPKKHATEALSPLNTYKDLPLGGSETDGTKTKLWWHDDRSQNMLFVIKQQNWVVGLKPHRCSHSQHQMRAERFGIQRYLPQQQHAERQEHPDIGMSPGSCSSSQKWRLSRIEERKVHSRWE